LREKVLQRIVSGALAGLAATLAMTVAMRRLHALLESRERCSLPPREIVGRAAIASDEQDARTKTLLAHFGFGALTGSFLRFCLCAVAAAFFTAWESGRSAIWDGFPLPIFLHPPGGIPSTEIF
jgi:hypothetical protein